MDPERQVAEDELLERARRGDEESLMVIYRRWHSVVFRFAFDMSGSQTLAEDVTQEVFLSLIRDPRIFDPQRARFSTYLYAIVRNCLIQQLRRDQTRQSAAQRASLLAPAAVVDDTDPVEDLSRNQQVQALRDAILRLPPRYREVIALCELEEMEYTEAAEMLGCPVGTVRSRLHRARAILAERLKASGSADQTTKATRRRRCLA